MERHNQEIYKSLVGYVVKLTEEKVSRSTESWYLPHHVVYHNDKACIVFNYSFEYQRTVLNHLLLPPSLLGVLLQFCQHTVTISCNQGLVQPSVPFARRSASASLPLEGWTA